MSHFWNKDSNVLFDYESDNYLITNISMTSSGYIYREDKKLLMKREYENSPDYIATITKKGDSYILHTNEQLEFGENKEKSLDEILWIVIRSTQYDNRHGHRLREGDKIKLGKVIFKVRELKSDDVQETLKNEIKTEPPNQKQIMNTNFRSTIKVNIKAQKLKVNPMCRICLADDNDPDDPLINPCACTGSVRFIHLNCLRKWLNSKIISKSFTFLTVHSYKNFECELCKEIIPERMKFRNDVLTLIEYQKPESNYIMLESISREKRENKYIYIIHMKNKHTVHLGRSNESDVRFTDISVSRNHAILTLSKGHFYLRDNYSKFGTSVQLQNEIVIIPGKQIAIQSCKLFLIFSLSKTCLSWITCLNNQSLCKLDYNTYLADKQPYYYMRELESLNIIDPRFSIWNIENESIPSKKSEINDNCSDVIDVDYKIPNDPNESKEIIKESQTANEDSILDGLGQVKTRNLENIQSARIVIEEDVIHGIFQSRMSNNDLHNSLNMTLVNNMNNISKEERENEFLLDRLNRRRNSREENLKKRKMILDKSKTENLSADFDLTKTMEKIEITPKNEKKKISLKNPKLIGIDRNRNNKNVFKNYFDYSSENSEKLILKENKVSDSYEYQCIEGNDYYMFGSNNSLNPERLQSLENKGKFNADDMNKIKTDDIINKIFLPCLSEKKTIQNNFLHKLDLSEENSISDNNNNNKVKTIPEMKERQSLDRISKNNTHIYKLSDKVSKINLLLSQENILTTKINNNYLKHSLSEPNREKISNIK